MSVHNVTVDDADTSGIIVYTNSHLSGWADQTCATCYAKPIDLTQVFDGTWHDTTHKDYIGDSNDLGVQFLFTGSAVYVYGIQVNSTSGIPIVNNSLIFTLDGQPAGNYTHTPKSPNYAYDVNFFSKTGLEHGPHNLTMALNGTSMVLFDYLVYTTNVTSPPAAPTPTRNSGSSNHTGAIVGGVVGGFAGLVILIFLIWALFFRRRRGVTRLSESPETETKTEDHESGTHRPAFLSRLQGHDTTLEVEPFTLAEREERERAQVNWGSKGSTMQRQGVSNPSSGGESSSRVGARTSVDPPSSGPSSQINSVSPKKMAMMHSPTPSQSASNMVSSSSTNMSYSEDNRVRESTVLPGMESQPSGTTQTIPEVHEDAPPAYGTAI